MQIVYFRNHFRDVKRIDNQNNSKILQKDLETLQTWERTWDMEFNRSKCRVLHISGTNEPIHSQYTLHSETVTLESVDYARKLELSILKDLTWNKHIKEILTKSNRTLCFVKRNVRTRNKSVKELAYKTFVRPKLEYASTIWSPHIATLGNLCWRSLEYCRYDSRLAMFYKIQYGLVAVQMPSYFERPKRITRHSQYNPLGCHQVFARTDYYRPVFVLSH